MAEDLTVVSPAQAREKDEKTLAFVTAQLRHAFSMLCKGQVTNQDQFARGFISPLIRRLEALAASPGQGIQLDRWNYSGQPSVAAFNHAVDVANANYRRVIELEAQLAQGSATPSEKERDLRLRLAERQIERMALCPDHRDKATGRCIVCQAEERTKEEVRAAQRSAATPAVIAEWQPIETAPKDGTYVILTDGDDVGDGWFDSGVFNGWSWANSYRARPTHWMPLPKPPLASLRAQEGR